MGRGLLLPLLTASCLLTHAHPWEPCGYDQDYDDLTRGLFPSVFNLASNAGITVNATCGETGPETYCKLVEHIYN
ncbi:hypothetical protein HPB47_004289, partial [Ixodes persulcatus]